MNHVSSKMTNQVEANRCYVEEFVKKIFFYFFVGAAILTLTKKKLHKVLYHKLKDNLNNYLSSMLIDLKRVCKSEESSQFLAIAVSLNQQLVFPMNLVKQGLLMPNPNLKCQLSKSILFQQIPTYLMRFQGYLQVWLMGLLQYKLSKARVS